MKNQAVQRIRGRLACYSCKRTTAQLCDDMPETSTMHLVLHYLRVRQQAFVQHATHAVQQRDLLTATYTLWHHTSKLSCTLLAYCMPSGCMICTVAYVPVIWRALLMSGFVGLERPADTGDPSSAVRCRLGSGTGPHDSNARLIACFVNRARTCGTSCSNEVYVC